MIQLPKLPPIYTTRHLDCISCGERLAVAEAFGKEQDDYRLKPNAQPDVLFRYMPERQRRMTTAVNRAVPNLDTMPPYSTQHERDNHILCPRCGADNRNWAQMQDVQNGRIRPNIQEHPALSIIVALAAPVLLGTAVILFIGDQHRNLSAVEIGVPTVSFIFICIILLLVFVSQPSKIFSSTSTMTAGGIGAVYVSMAVFFILFNRDPSDLWARAVPMATGVFLAGFLPAISILPTWRALLQIQRLRQYLPHLALPTWKMPHIQRSVAVASLLVVVLPVVFYFFLPIGLNVVLDRVNARAETAVRLEMQRLNQQAAGWLAGDLSDEHKAALTTFQEDIKRDLDIMKDGVRWEDVNRAINHITKAAANSPEEVAVVLNIVKISLQSYQDALTPIPDQFPRAVFLIWVVVIGGMVLFSTVTAVAEVNRTVAQAAAQLPPPIYASVASLTRVVTAELRHALDIPGDMSHIQWMQTNRNEFGGVTMQGLHRDMPQYDSNGRLLDTLIPAQHYTIITDKWGRIQKASIRDRYVPVTVGAPGFIINELSQHQPASQTVAVLTD
ncbi:MAG: hypothetical protein Kow0080_12930 [Candidatus Promineifilaceae bacterium]